MHGIIIGSISVLAEIGGNNGSVFCDGVNPEYGRRCSEILCRGKNRQQHIEQNRQKGNYNKRWGTFNGNEFLVGECHEIMHVIFQFDLGKLIVPFLFSDSFSKP